MKFALIVITGAVAAIVALEIATMGLLGTIFFFIHLFWFVAGSMACLKPKVSWSLQSGFPLAQPTTGR